MVWMRTCFVLLALLLLAACEETIITPEAGPDFSITAVEVPDKIDVTEATLYRFAFKVTHPSGQEAIDNVVLDLQDSSGSAVVLSVQLLDDGSAVNAQSGDIVARDGVYSMQVLSDSLVFSRGTFYASATANAGSENLSSSAQAFFADRNVAPEVLNLTIADTLVSGSAPQSFTATVRDLNTLADIATATFRILDNGQVLTEVPMSSTTDSTATSGEYVAMVDSGLGAGLLGDYQASVLVEDILGVSSESVRQNIHIENEAPFISSPSLRDTLQRPASGSDTLQVKLTANDQQSLLDIGQVQFTVTLIGGTTSNPIAMFDDGNPTPSSSDNGDQVAGDGRFSQIIAINSTNQPGSYVFEFSAIDKVGQSSFTITDTLVVLP